MDTFERSIILPDILEVSLLGEIFVVVDLVVGFVMVNILLAFGVMKLEFAPTDVAWYLHIIFKIKVLDK